MYDYRLRYSTPYKEPPEGMDRVQLTVRELGGPGCDWVICVQSIEAPTQAARGSARRTWSAGR